MPSRMNTKGPTEVASERGEDRKVDLVVGELARYDMVIGALQETKWFSCRAYKVGHRVVLTSGRRPAGEGGCLQREEGAAPVLRGQDLAAWRCGGQQRKAWNPGCVSAVLQADKSTVTTIHVVSCYALT